MAGFVTGADRTQGTMFPAQLEDYVAADNPVRVIDFFISNSQFGLGWVSGGPAQPNESAAAPLAGIMAGWAGL